MKRPLPPPPTETSAIADGVLALPPRTPRLMVVQVRDRAGNIMARERTDDPDTALAIGMRWMSLMVEDAADPLADEPWDTAAVEIVPEVLLESRH